MFCIAAFIVFAILGIFSAAYRKLAKKAWHCVLRRITFRPCDINFSEEVKGRLLGKIIITKPRLAKFLSKWFDWMALIFVILSIWSLWSVFWAGLNLWVYDTCDPGNAESCSLAGEACSIESRHISFIDAIEYNQIGEWVVQSFNDAGQTFSRIPDRLKSWNAEEYLSPTATFYYPNNSNKPYAIEILDPSCQFCKKLFGNIIDAGFENNYYFSYILYPIPDPNSAAGYKFPNSYLMASYIEATKKVALDNNPKGISPDWLLLEKIFTAQTEDGTPWQTKFATTLTPEQAEKKLQEFLKDIGYSDEKIAQITTLAQSEEIKAHLLEQKNIVEDKVKTVKIPTILFKGRRYDRVIDKNILMAP